MNEIIEEILDRFPWETVQAGMAAADWKWHVRNTKNEYESPSFSRMRRTAKRLLQEVADGKTSIETGGFRAYTVCGELRLDFILASAEEVLPEKSS